MTEYTPEQSRRLLAAVFMVRRERALEAVARFLWKINEERGPFNWLGDRADDLALRSSRWRARRGRHLAGRRTKGRR